MSKLGGKKMSEDTDRDNQTAGVVETIVAGDRISVNSADPANPIVTADVQAGGQVDSVVGGTNCSVDATDPVNPIVNADTQNNAKVTTKGDLEGFSTVAARVPVGSNGQVLTADSAEALGLKWATPSAGGDVATDTIFDAKGDLAGGTGADTAARLPVGTNGQVLSADSAEATGMKWIAAAGGYTDPLTTKGDLVAFNTSTDRLAVGSNDQVLTADSTAAEGVAWKTAASGGTIQGCVVTRVTNQTMGTNTNIQFTAEDYDDDSFATLGTNNDRLTVPTGVTRVNLSAFMNGTGHTIGGRQQMSISHFNSSDAFQKSVAGNDYQVADTAPRMSVAAIGVQVVAGDYFVVSMFGVDSSWTLTNAQFAIQDVSP